VLWVHRRPEGVVAVADLGPVLVAVSGRTPPPGAWAARLLDPAAARDPPDGDGPRRRRAVRAGRRPG
jgi:hypothetical protein